MQSCEYCFHTSTHQNAGLHCPQLWMQRADLQTNNCLQAELRGVRALQCWVLKPSSCHSWTQLDVTRSKRGAGGHKCCPGVNVKDMEPSLSWLWTYHAFSLGECNLNFSYTFLLPTSHQSWHPMQTAFRNRVWDTRDAVHVLFILVIPVYRKAYLDAVNGFQRMSQVWEFYSIFASGW